MGRFTGLVLVCAVVLVFAGCGLFQQVDVQAAGVTALYNASTGVLTGVKVDIKNNGPDVSRCEFDIVLVATGGSAIVTTADPLVYVGNYSSSIANQATVTTSVTKDQLDIPAGTADGNHIFGLIVDPNHKLGDTNSSNDTTASAGNIDQPLTWVIGGQFMAGIVSGFVTIPGGLQYDPNENNSLTPVESGSYNLYCVMVPNGYSGTSYDSIPGSQKIPFTYSSGSGSSDVQYTIGVPAWGSYYGLVYMDVNNDGTSVQYGANSSMTEPFAFYPDPGSNGGVPNAPSIISVIANITTTPNLNLYNGYWSKSPSSIAGGSRRRLWNAPGISRLRALLLRHGAGCSATLSCGGLSRSFVEGLVYAQPSAARQLETRQQAPGQLLDTSAADPGRFHPQSKLRYVIAHQEELVDVVA